MRRLLRTRPAAALMALALLLGLTMSAGYAKASHELEPLGPYSVASMTVTLTSPSTGDAIQTNIYYPSDDGSRVDPSGAPYPTLVFARGFFSFPASYAGWGEHLASWGYVIGIPDFPSEDQEDRASDVQHLLSYLEAENDRGASIFFESIDVARFGLTGHSKGGMTALIVTARDDRIKAAVALDPAGMDSWDYATQAPDIKAPTAILGAPSQMCNSSAEYNDVFPVVGATHKALYVITDGSHCDFMNTDDELQVQLCSLFCGRSFSEDRLRLAERYTTAWFNYYLLYNPAWHAYLYGEEAGADVQAGRLTADVHTAPRNVSATGQPSGIELHWTLYDHPMVAGYDIYRGQQSGDYPSAPAAQVGRVSGYSDSGVVACERYYYVLASRDGAGQQHELSEEVGAVPGLLPPEAGFHASPADGCAPLTVTFTDTSTVDTSVVPTNTIEGWHWQFGDNVGSSTDQGPSYTYEESGTYTVTLTITDSQGCSNTTMRPRYITVNPPPVASFDARPAEGCAPLTVIFTDTSTVDTSVVPTNTIEGWHWRFGDGVGSSTDQDGSYSYKDAGTHTVTLTVTDAQGCASATELADAVAVHSPPATTFNCGPAEGCTTWTVLFTDTSVADASLVPGNVVESWHWDFGDGTQNSTDQNPTHIYEQAGVYTVSLTVTDTHGCASTEVETNAIAVNPEPMASFDVEPSVGEAPLEVSFADTSVANTSMVPANGIEMWHWDFGDGAGSSSDQHPTYGYEEPGIYTVTLTVVDFHGCSDQAVDSVAVVDAFDSFIYLPLVTRDLEPEASQPAPTVIGEPRALAPPPLTRAWHLLRELLSRVLSP